MPADGSQVDVLLALPAHLSSLEVLEGLLDEPRLSPVFRAGIRREVTRAHAARREHEARSGVRWSGMDADPYRVRSVADLKAEADRVEAARNSPRGRFLAALSGVEQIDPGRGGELRALYARELADDRKPLNTAAVGAAITKLTPVAGKAARDALDALAELLMARAA